MIKKGLIKVKTEEGLIQLLPVTTAEQVIIPDTSSLGGEDVLTVLETLKSEIGGSAEIAVLTNEEIDTIFDSSEEV